MLRLDNRQLLIFLYACSTAGTLIMTDWQSLRGDPCNQFNASYLPQEYDGIFDSHNSSESYFCEQYGNSSYNCFWNPVSRITGDYCERCRQVCLSSEYSLNFIQLVVGMILLIICMSNARLLVTTIASDVSRGDRQVRKTHRVMQAYPICLLLYTAGFSDGVSCCSW